MAKTYNYGITHLKQLAEEAELGFYIDAANTHHLERISKAEDNCEVWYNI